MNFSKTPSSEDLIKSLHHWWSLAGVEEDFNREPASLLTQPTQPTSQPPEAVVPEVQNRPEIVPEIAPEVIAPDNFPDDHDKFIQWLSQADNLIEKSWAKEYILPTGILNPDVMIISAMPETNNLPENGLFAPRSYQLIKNMMSAIGVDSENLYISGLAIARSPDGRIQEKDQTLLKARMLHHIDLVQPKRIILFGEGVTMALFGKNLLTVRKNKRFINHVSSKTETIATFHPRILLDRPEFKAEAWKDLQLLTRTNAP